MITLKKILTNKPILKINACILGYFFWYLLSQMRPIEITVSIPLTFYGTNKEIVEAPETITICLRGYKKDLYALNIKELAAHMNVEKFHEGKNHLKINNETLFLPSEIKLLHYNPSNVVAQVKNK